MRLSKYIILILTSLILILTACKDEEFTSSSSYKISFSVDTLSFDTIFTDMLTPTMQIKVYNRTSENIKINSISLESETKCFQVNVNGLSGINFNNIELRSKDSLYIFVQAKISEQDSNTPVFVKDSLMFNYNGNEQKIILTTIGRDVHRLKKYVVKENEHWTNDKPFLIYDTMTVAKDAVLTIDEASELYFYNSSVMKIEGTIIINGSYDKPVILRGHRTDYIYDKTKYDKIVGQWGGIIINKKSYNNKINGAIIRSATFGIKIDSTENIETRKLTLSNSIIHNIKGIGLQCTNANVYVYNCEISNCLQGCVLLEGGDYLFNHITIANFPRNSRYHNALTLSNKIYNTKKPIIPLKKAEFNNCIIYGSYKKEIEFSSYDDSDDNNDDNFNYHFNYCMIKYEESDFSFYENKRFTNVLWNEDVYFKNINHDDYEYDFSLDLSSVAIDAADPLILNNYPECKSDLNGRQRPSGEGSDIGAYEYIAVDSENKDVE